MRCEAIKTQRHVKLKDSILLFRVFQVSEATYRQRHSLMCAEPNF